MPKTLKRINESSRRLFEKSFVSTLHASVQKKKNTHAVVSVCFFFFSFIFLERAKLLFSSLIALQFTETERNCDFTVFNEISVKIQLASEHASDITLVGVDALKSHVKSSKGLRQYLQSSTSRRSMVKSGEMK